MAAQSSGKAAAELPRYLRAAEVADILYVSPKTVARWAMEGKLPSMKTLGGHRRFPGGRDPRVGHRASPGVQPLGRSSS